MKFSGLIVILCTGLSATGQTFKVSTGDTYTYKGEYGIPISLAQSHLHLVSKEKRLSYTMEVAVRKTDTADRTVLGESKNEIKVTVAMGARLIKAGSGVGILYQDMDKKGVTGNIMIADVDTNTLAIAEPRVLVDLQEAGFTTQLKNETVNSQRLQVKKSPDQAYFLYWIYNEQEAARFYLAVFDNKLKLKWQGKEQLSTPDKEVVQYDAAIDNDGKVYVAYRVDTKGKINNEGRVAVYDAGKKLKELYLDLPGSIPGEIKLLASQNKQQVHVAGYYFNYGGGAYHGVFAGGIRTADLSLLPMRRSAFPDELVQQFVNDGWGPNKQEPGRGLTTTIKGKLTELGNFQPAFTGEFRSSGFTNDRYYSYSGSILHSYFAPAQTHFARLPKYRISAASTIGDSYSVFALADKMVIFYNDDIDNLSKDIKSKPANSNVYKNVVMVGAVMNADGQLSRQLVIDMKKDNFMALTDKIQSRGHQFHVPCFEVKSLGGINDNYRPVVVALQ